MAEANGRTGIGDWDEQRPVKAFTVWRSQFSDTSGAGKDYVLSAFLYRVGEEPAVLHEMSEEPLSEDVQWMWTKTWGQLEYSTPGHQFLIYDFFTADSLEAAEEHVQRFRERVSTVGMFGGEPIRIIVPETPEVSGAPAGYERVQMPLSVEGVSAADLAAASWAVAAALVSRLGSTYEFQEAHPGGGQSDTLAFVDGSKRGPGIFVGIGSSIHIIGDRPERIPMDPRGWLAVVNGIRPVMDLVEEIMRSVPPQDGVCTQVEAVRFLADLARDAALFATGWRIEAGWCDTSGEDCFYWEERYAAFEPLLNVPGPHASGPDRKWFVLDASGRPVLALDERGAVLSTGWGTWVPFDQALPKIASMMSGAAGQGAVTSLGLQVLLSKFNRKERFFVVVDAVGGDRDELHEPSLRLTADFRQKLEATIRMPVPAHAWASIDFHLNWLHAALQWKTEPGLLHQVADRFTADGVELVSGNQEDIDLIVAWTSDDGEPVVVFIEAKAYSSWTNKQVGHKVPRLTAILDSAISAGLALSPLLVLSGPARPSQALDVSGWPTWGQGDGQPLYLELPVAGLRLGVERVGEDGKPARSGTKWAFKHL